MGESSIPPNLPPDQSARLGIRTAPSPHEPGVEEDVEVYDRETGQAVETGKANPLPEITPERWRQKFTSDEGDLTIVRDAQGENRFVGQESDLKCIRTPEAQHQAREAREQYDSEQRAKPSEDPVAAHRFALISAFKKEHHRFPDEAEMRAICQAAFVKAGVTPPEPAPLPDNDDDLV